MDGTKCSAAKQDLLTIVGRSNGSEPCKWLIRRFEGLKKRTKHWQSLKFRIFRASLVASYWCGMEYNNICHCKLSLSPLVFCTIAYYPSLSVSVHVHSVTYTNWGPTRHQELLYILSVQSVLLALHTSCQGTAATKWSLVTWTGSMLDENVAEYTEMLIYWSSMMHRNSLQLLECSHQRVSIHCLLSAFYL